jgi:hypothetical protein
MVMKKRVPNKLTPMQAARAGARLAGFVAHTVKLSEGVWQADVIGELVLPDGTGKQTEKFIARATKPLVAQTLATEDCERNYPAPRSEPDLPLAG